MSSHRVLVIGTGYVGLTTAACLVDLGHRVTGLDIDETKVERLARGEIPIYEQGLSELVESGLASGRLSFTTSADAVGDHDIIMLCLPTPAMATGGLDLSAVRAAIGEYRTMFKRDAIVVTKSTVPLGTYELLQSWISRSDIHLVSNPEFLREGSAVADFMHPDRIVVGAESSEAAQTIAGLYVALDSEVVQCDPLSAELIKYASNAFLATKLSFVNEMARICDELGADVTAVTRGLGTDHRIAPTFLTPGPGWGGSCFPKDVAGLAHLARSSRLRVPVVESAAESNRDHFEHLVNRTLSLIDRPLTDSVVAIWGLAFKAGTDDTRSSPAIELIERLKTAQCEIRAHDPIARIGDELGVTQAGLYDVCDGADIVLLMTEWPQFADADLGDVAGRLRQRTMFDMRGIIDQAAARAAGISLHTLGRPQK